jgi:hypothetical protein
MAQTLTAAPAIRPQVGDVVRYTGKAQSSSVGETLDTGDLVRVAFIRDTFGLRSYGVDKSSDAVGTGRTYTVWTAWSGQIAEA